MWRERPKKQTRTFLLWRLPLVAAIESSFLSAEAAAVDDDEAPAAAVEERAGARKSWEAAVLLPSSSGLWSSIRHAIAPTNMSL